MHIIYADGIGSNQPGVVHEQSVLYDVIERLVILNKEYKPDRVIWPASMATVGGTKSWDESTLIGLAAIDEIVASLNGETFILLGYSGGCRVIREWLERNPQHLPQVVAVGMLSDPYRPKSRKQAELADTIGWGICGQRFGPIPDRTYWTTVPGDVVSDAREDALLRTAADASNVMPGQFIGDLARHLDAGDLQLAYQLKLFRTNPVKWLVGLGPRLHQARIDIEGYLGGMHTTAYQKPYAGGGSLAHRLADSINWKATHRD
ncbi:lysin B [Gordonia phage Schwartz33]|nr:lysin B [Gordonia phage Schwartz33]